MTRPSTADLVALDVGGANIKAADGLGWTHGEAFAVWRDWRRLAAAITAILRPRAPRRVVATMTGEIADCYRSRAAGVEHIVGAVAEAAAAAGCAEEVGIYLVDGRIVPPAEAVARPLEAAASNWHAIARLAASQAATDRCFLVDVGSTTTDIVPIAAGRPAPLACDDAGRMQSGELVYTGVERTPLPAIVRSLPHGGVRRPVSSERFAESRDAWLVLGALAEEPAACDTADGAAATREAARVRLARTLLVEPDSFSLDDAVAAADWCAEAQARLVARGFQRVVRGRGWRPTSVVLSGHGGCLARRAIERLAWPVTVVSLPDSLGPAISRVAPAHALAVIARGLLS
jgi:probable H4MPT-linked C1 transfer pathway protein